MAEKTNAAPEADQPAAPLRPLRVTHLERGGVHYPALILKGPAPRKGSALRVQLENGVIYTAKVHDAVAQGGETLVETNGLEPERAEPDAPPPSDIVPG